MKEDINQLEKSLTDELVHLRKNLKLKENEFDEYKIEIDNQICDY